MSGTDVNGENKPDVNGSDGKIHHKTSINGGVAFVLIALVAAIVILEYQIDTQKHEITKLTDELNKTNIIMNTLINDTLEEKKFEQDVKDYAKLINTHILNIYNKTGVSRP